MRKYNVENYIRYKRDVKEILTSEVYERSDYENLTRDQIIIKFLPLNIPDLFAVVEIVSTILGDIGVLLVSND